MKVESIKYSLSGLACSGALDLFVMRDAKAVVIVVRLVARIRAAFVHDEQPIGVRVLEHRLAVMAIYYFEREQLFENRQRVVERAALVMSVGQSYRAEHANLPFTTTSILYRQGTIVNETG